MDRSSQALLSLTCLEEWKVVFQGYASTRQRVQLMDKYIDTGILIYHFYA